MKEFLRKCLLLVVWNTVVRRSISIPKGKKIIWRVSPGSQLKYLKSTFDNELSQFVENHVTQSDIVWDIGANCGTFTAFCLSKGVQNKVILVEPDIFLMSILLKNAEKNNIMPLCAAVSDDNDILELNIAERGRASNSISKSLGRSERGNTRFKHAVLAISLDYLATRYNTPTIVKMDIEGAEHLAVRGGIDLIKMRMTKFLIEIDASNKNEVFNVFQENNYTNEEMFDDNFLFTPKY
jgi:FkbM family methyltransferase